MALCGGKNSDDPERFQTIISFLWLFMFCKLYCLFLIMYKMVESMQEGLLYKRHPYRCLNLCREMKLEGSGNKTNLHPNEK